MKRIFALFCISLINTSFAEGHQNYFQYCENPIAVEYIPSTIYQEAVQNLPIPCVDVFLYDPDQNAYLLIKRGNPPAKDVWWFPGGRIYKGESFFDAAVRKCWTEVKVKTRPVAQLGTYSTVFPDSNWGCQSHTINTVILVVKTSEMAPELDCDHEDFEWRSLEKRPDHDPYLDKAYSEALHYLKTN